MSWRTGGINKGWLVELLRKHPNWNENVFAVVFDITVNRDIDVRKVHDCKDEVCLLSTTSKMPPDDSSALCKALTTIAAHHSKLLASESCVEAITRLCGVKCAVGQKSSRVINKICKEYGLDKHPEFNARFARLADALNPLHVQKTALLSVHPCDYLEMSNVHNSWASCHNLEDGCYRAGTLSYLMDSCSMIFYTVEEGQVKNTYHAAKTTREMFFYTDGTLLQSRLYPNTHDEETKEIYRNLVQQTISQCLDVPNLWHLHRGIEAVGRYAGTAGGALHYPDYDYEEYNASISLLDGDAWTHPRLYIGTHPICMNCSAPMYEADSALCTACDENYNTCADCGCRISGDDIYEVDDEIYCYECVDYCDLCCEHVRGVTTPVHTSAGHTIYYCSECLSDSTITCSECGNIYVSSCATEVDGEYYCPTCAETLVESTPA